ncbi:ADP-ribosyltransferase [Actinopolymorpha pittospori]|uniref:ADP ribosyltransferase domain-containing protein n=1 Tax=Actinopolymorpha pittospori TaxID=648752 RepID=A0A927MWW5_9ACTN|nr:ADP-ribosyltransferase [Actinopolymorpha pittospori]MBE1606253.1 hypothetical protein [Actinopolymorpha pittospori]
MPATKEGLALAEAHRLAQKANTDQALLSVTAAFQGLLDPKDLDKSYRAYAKVAATIVNGHRAKSSGLAASFYQALRAMETTAPPLESVGLAEDVNPVALDTSLAVTGPVAAKAKIAGGISPTDALVQALQMTLGAVTRHVEDGGRDTIRKAVQSDSLATGWARRSGGNPCSFCAMLIGRGPAYKSSGSSSFRTHDHCHCEAVPVFEGDTGWTAQATEFRAVWDESTVGLSGKEARAAFNRAHSERWPMASPAQVRTAAYGQHVVKTAEAIAKKAAEEAAAAAKAAEELAAKAAAKEAAKVKKWKGKPAPTAPKSPTAPKTAKQKALDDWLGKVNARYDALGTGKKLSQSFNYSYVERVIEHGDLGALDYLKANRYIDDALESEAKAALKASEGFTPADETAYKKALRSYKNNSTRYTRYLAEWREVNGISVQLKGMDGALDFTSDRAALDWAGKTFHRFDKNDAAKRALKTYTGGSYRAWNDALRAEADGTALPKGWEDLTRDADAGIDRSPFPEDTYVRRGTAFDEFEFDGGLRTAHIPPPDPRELIGTVQTQHGYMSTSIGTTAAFSHSPVQILVRVPQGHNGAYVDYFSNFTGEREVLLQRSTDLFIHAVYKVGRTWHIEAEVIPAGVDPASLKGHPTMPRASRA